MSGFFYDGNVQWIICALSAVNPTDSTSALIASRLAPIRSRYHLEAE
jgi:hypothetical protein